MIGDPAFSVDVVDVNKGSLRHKAVVFCPTRAAVHGRARLNTVSAGTGLTETDRWMLAQVEHRGVSIAIMRSVNDRGERVWSIDPELKEAETLQLGYAITRSLLPCYRGMVKAGIALLAYTDWGFKETEAMRGGVQRMLEVLEERPRAHAAVQELDLWILKNLIFHFAMPYHHILDNVLPDHLRAIELRSARTKELMQKVPELALE